MKKLVSILVLTLILISQTYSQSLTKISGLAYFDYFYNIKNKIDSLRDSQGFQFRRIFLTFDFDVTNKLSTRFRLEQESQGNQTKQFLFLKDMYFQYKFDDAQLFAGLIPTPGIDVEEKYWGYRSVEKIQSDLRGWISTRDLGISLKSNVKEKSSYVIMVGNNSSHGTEIDKYKRLYFHFFNQFENAIGASIDFTFANGPQNKNIFFSKLGLFRSSSNYSGGVTFVYFLKQRLLANNENLNEYGLSLFGNYKFLENWKALLRFDVYEPDLKATSDKELTLIGGIDYKLEKNLNIIPNFIYNDYENKNLKDDLTFRLTFYYQF